MKQIRPITVVPYNPEWPEMFELESAKIVDALGDNCLAIHHVGSTSVPGLIAKPKIDSIAVVQEPTETIDVLEAIGMEYRGEYNIPMHYGFSKRGDIDLNLHVYEEGHPEIELNLMFRDYLRKYSSIRNEYAALKRDLLQNRSSFEKKNSLFTGYNLGKDSFIRKTLKEAGFNRTRLLRCTHYAEWDAAKNFRQKYFFDAVPISDPYTWTFDHPDHAHLVLYQGTEIIGYAHIQFWFDLRTALRIIVIDPLKRKQSFGRQFLLIIEKWLIQRGYKGIYTESSPEVLRFYENCGYTHTPFNDPDGYTSDPRDIPMGKLLS